MSQQIRKCGYCGVEPGQHHTPGCDIERCPRCGRQAISCNCIYEVCGMNPHTLEEDYPGIYGNGPTPEMYEKWDAEWGGKRQPWSGEYPGAKECREFGWYARLLPGRGWVSCGKDEPGASEDLNRLMIEAVWDRERQRFVLQPDIRQPVKYASVEPPQSKQYRCSRGHAWTQPLWGHPCMISFPGADEQKRWFCLFCVVGFLEKHVGVVTEEPTPPA